MNKITRIIAVAVGLLVMGGLAQPAQAQLGGLGGKLKQKAKEAAEKAAQKAAGDKAEEEAEEAAAGATEKAAKAAGVVPTGGSSIGGGKSASSGATVDFRELKALLPTELAGMSLEDATGEQGKAFGIATSNATGSYSTGDGQTIQVKIMDLGTVRNWAMLGFAWTAAEVDRETEDGYERTIKYQDKYPGYAEYSDDGDSKDAKLSVIVAERFVVEVEGDGVEMAAVEAALAKVDVSKLEAMKGPDVAPMEVADFQVLKALLPAQVAGLSRTAAEGEKSNVMNIVTSYAEGRYGSEDKQITLKIQDAGTLQSFTALGYGWIVTASESETDTGYEKTGQYKGHPSHERYSTEGGAQTGSLEIFVGKRYLVSAEGTGVTMEQIKAAVDAVDVAKLPVPAP